MGAAGVIADHAAQGTAVMRRGIGGKSQVVLLGGPAQVVQYYPRLNARQTLPGVKAENVLHVTRQVEHDSNVTGLASGAGAAAACQNGDIVGATDGDSGADVVA